MKRVSYVGKSKRRTNKRKQIIRAFNESGAETLWLNPNRIRRWRKDKTDEYILGKIESFRPDIIFISSLDIPLSVLREISGRITTVIYFVDPWRHDLLPKVAEWGRLADYFLVTAKGVIPQYMEAGVKNPIYVTESCDRHDHRIRRPILDIWKSDVAFVGAARPDERRVDIVSRLKGSCNVRVYGRNWERFGIQPTLGSVGPRGYSLICSGAGIVLGADSRDDIEGYWSDRLYYTLGCGGLLLTNYVPGMEVFFENRKHLVWYHSVEECISLVEEYLKRPDERKRIALEGYRHVHENFTFHHLAKMVLEMCEAKGPVTGTDAGQ